MSGSGVVVLGIYVADVTFRAERAPRMGETILGKAFQLGPGGKGSNQAVAAARAGAETTFLSRIGDDPFADMALKIWADAGVTSAAVRDPESYTGAASIFIDDASGDNSIIVCPGAALEITPAHIDAAAETIGGAAVCVTQLEQPVNAAVRGLEVARAAGVTTIFNPAPAVPVDDGIWGLCDYVTPNETEAAEATGLPVASIDDARRAGDALLAKGVGTALITLVEAGALLHTANASTLVPAISAGPVVETTGAGDSFNGAFAAALSKGHDPVAAARSGCAAAGISVTRPGTASSMPKREEIEAALAAD